MKRIIFIAILLSFIFLYIGCKHTSNATSFPKGDCEMKVQNSKKPASKQEVYQTPEDSMLALIYDQIRKDEAENIYYSNKSKNTKQIVPTGFVKVPDSIAYAKTYYKNGKKCSEGLLVYFDCPEMDDASEVGQWKYWTPDGTKFSKKYKYTIGVVKEAK